MVQLVMGAMIVRIVVVVVSLIALSMGQMASAGGYKLEMAEPDKSEQSANLDTYQGVGLRKDFDVAIQSEKRGFELLKQHRADKALDKLQEAVGTYPCLPKAHYHIGRIREKQGDSLKAAEDAYRNSLKYDTTNYRVWKQLAGVLYQQQKYVEARHCLANAVALRPPAHARIEIDKMIQAVGDAEKSGQ
jgi:tetratricopeptide (TPR) repeat protein